MHRFSKMALCLAVSAVLPTATPAQPGSELVSVHIGQAPALDGSLEDACWAAAAATDAFSLPLSTQPPAKPVTVQVAHDDAVLYLAFTCDEPEPAGIKASAAPGSDRVWQDDCVEVWLGVGPAAGDVDQFIVNAAGVRQSLRLRGGRRQEDPQLEWAAAAAVGEAAWTAEIAIPFNTLGLDTPRPGTLLRAKLGREDYVSGAPALSTWPARSPYSGTEGAGRLYLGDPNLLPNPDMSRQTEGRATSWGFGENDASLFSSVEDEGRPAIRFPTPDRYCVAQQNLRLKPESVYRLSARVRGTAGVYLRARTSSRPGEASTAYTATTRPSEEYEVYEVQFPTGQDGSALIILGSYGGLGLGEVFIADLQVREDLVYESEGPAVALTPGKTAVVTKALVTDCRALKGFITAPVDGRLSSYDWNMGVWEYNTPGAGAGVGYRYRDNDGLHIALADDLGVDAVQIRRGARVKLYAGSESYDDPGDAPLLWTFEGRARNSRALFSRRVPGGRFSFFDLQDGQIADVCFLRLSETEPEAVRRTVLSVGPAAETQAPEHLTRRFGDGDRRVHALGSAAAPLNLEAGRTVHFVAPAPGREMALGAVAFRLSSPTAPAGCPVTLSVQDPLNGRQELMGVDFTIGGGGELTAILDFPDQIVGPERGLWLSATFGSPVRLDRAQVELYEVPRGQALAEALAFRKLIMRGLFCQLSEARQWGTIRRDTDLEEWYAQNHWGPGVRDLAETIAAAKELGPEDDLVRCYDEWVWRSVRDLPRFEPRIHEVPGAPEWAVLARQAWLTSREVPRWWIDNRLVPTGEFGGLVGDDSDMYQNYADLPMFEGDGVAAEILAGAANLAELAELEHLEQGLNRRTMDPLHAYEEGVNHEALMVLWNYGDPVYLERCLLAAKSMPALTTVTGEGHRHFKNQDCGAEDLRIDRELGVDGHAHPLMWHPCFEVAWYNGSPRVIEYLREWADGWLQHMEPGKYATSVDVRTEQVIESGPRPLYGGYGGQASAHGFLYRLTDESRYLWPFMDIFRRGEDNYWTRRHIPELWHRGFLDGLENLDTILGHNPVTRAVALGDKSALAVALKADIAELQRFGTMYKEAEVFTDRVFLDAVTTAAICYTGGYATRNKYNHTHAVSWEGFGTDYAALVLRARRDELKVLLYNFASETIAGTARVWALDHGRYRITLGPDTDGDDNPDTLTIERSAELARADVVPVTLPPGVVTVLHLQQIEALDDILLRPDLALCAREFGREGGTLTGVVHNIGGGDAPACTLALVDAAGRTRAVRDIAPLKAPVDLEPKREPFSFDNLPADTEGWRVVVDPDGLIPELCEANNAAGL